jgi:hypothetical protein
MQLGPRAPEVPLAEAYWPASSTYSSEAALPPKAFTVGYYLDRLGGYWPGLGRGLKATAERVHVAQWMWAPDFRDRMMVIARRR